MHTTGTRKRLLKIQNLLKIALFCVVGTKMCHMCAHKKIFWCLIHTYLMSFKINFGGPGVFSGRSATPQISKMPQNRPQKKLSYLKIFDTIIIVSQKEKKNIR